MITWVLWDVTWLNLFLLFAWFLFFFLTFYFFQKHIPFSSRNVNQKSFGIACYWLFILDIFFCLRPCPFLSITLHLALKCQQAHQLHQIYHQSINDPCSAFQFTKCDIMSSPSWSPRTTLWSRNCYSHLRIEETEIRSIFITGPQRTARTQPLAQCAFCFN